MLHSITQTGKGRGGGPVGPSDPTKQKRLREDTWPQHQAIIGGHSVALHGDTVALHGVWNLNIRLFSVSPDPVGEIL